MGAKEEPEFFPSVPRRRTSGKSPRALFSPAEKLNLVRIIKTFLTKKAGIKSSDEELNVTLFCRKHLSNHPLLSHASSVFHTKMTNIARSFLSPETERAFEELEALIKIDSGRRVVWPVLEKRAFVPLTVFGKVTVLRAMAERQQMKIRTKEAGNVESSGSDFSAGEQVSFVKMTDLEWSAEEKNMFLEHIEKLTNEVLRIIKEKKVDPKWLYEGHLKSSTHSVKDGFAGLLSAMCHHLPFFSGSHFKETRKHSMASSIRSVNTFAKRIAELVEQNRVNNAAASNRASGSNGSKATYGQQNSQLAKNDQQTDKNRVAKPNQSNGSPTKDNSPPVKHVRPNTMPLIVPSRPSKSTTAPVNQLKASNGNNAPKGQQNAQPVKEIQQTGNNKVVKLSRANIGPPTQQHGRLFFLEKPQRRVMTALPVNTSKSVTAPVNQLKASNGNNAPNGQQNTKPVKDIQQTGNNKVAKLSQPNDSSAQHKPQHTDKSTKDVSHITSKPTGNADNSAKNKGESSNIPVSQNTSNARSSPPPHPTNVQPQNQKVKSPSHAESKGEMTPPQIESSTLKKGRASHGKASDDKDARKQWLPIMPVYNTTKKKPTEVNQSNEAGVNRQPETPKPSEEGLQKTNGPSQSAGLSKQTAIKPAVSAQQAGSSKSHTKTNKPAANPNQMTAEQAEQVTEKPPKLISDAPSLNGRNQHQETSSQSIAVQGTSDMKRRLRSSTRAQATGISSSTSVGAPAAASGPAPVSRKRTPIAFCQTGREREQSISNMSDADHPFKKKRLNYRAIQSNTGHGQRLETRLTSFAAPNMISSTVGDSQPPRANRSFDMDREYGLRDGWVINYVDKDPTAEDSTIANARRVRLYLDMYRRYEQNVVPSTGTLFSPIDRVNPWMPAAVMSSPIARTLISKENMDTIKTHLSRVTARAFDPSSLFQSQQVVSMAARAFFALRRSELHLQGFTRLDGILKSSMKVGLKQRVDKLLHFVDSDFTTNFKNLAEPSNADTNCAWSLFPNNTTTDKGIYQSQPRKLEDAMPEDTILTKAFVDSCMGRILELILPEEGDVPVLMFPNHGSTFIRMKKCDNLTHDKNKALARTNFQSPDCLEGLVEYHTPPPLYNVFIMFSGRQPFVMRVWPGSHISMNVKKSVRAETLERLHSKLVVVPPYSVFVGRGDLVHAVATTEEVKMMLQGNYEKKELGVERMEWMNRGFIDDFNTRGYIQATRGSYVSQQTSPLMSEIDINDHNMNTET